MDSWLYLLAAAALCVGLTPLAWLTSRRLYIYDVPSQRKVHRQPTPLLGGAAIAVAFYAMLGIRSLQEGRPPDVCTWFTGPLILVLGLADDIGNYGVLQKLLGQIAVALAAAASGAAAAFTGQPYVDLALSMFWIVTLINVVNFVDNMNGLCAGTVALISIALFLIGGMPQALILAGACLGFLVFNFRTPSRVFMGDMGSMFLGLMLAIITLRFMDTAGGWPTPVVQCIVLMGYPLADTCLVVVGRIAHGRPFYRGGPDHSSHRLVGLGLTDRRAVLSLWVVVATYCALAVVIGHVGSGVAVLLVAAAAALTLVGLVVMLRVPIYKSLRLAAQTHAAPGSR